MKEKRRKIALEYIGETGVRYLTEDELVEWFDTINDIWRRRMPSKALGILDQVNRHATLVHEMLGRVERDLLDSGVREMVMARVGIVKSSK